MKSIALVAAAIAGEIAPRDSDRAAGIANEYKQELRAAFARGELRLHSASTFLPMPHDCPGAAVRATLDGALSLDEANRWLAASGIPVQLSETSFARVAPRPISYASTHETVIESARRHADRLGKKMVDEEQKEPSANNLKARVAQALNAEFNLTLDGETVRRNCLVGWVFSYRVESVNAVAAAARPAGQENFRPPQPR